MIARIWHGWTTPDKADAYFALLTGEIMPEIASRGIEGFLSYDVLRRDLPDEVEFTTILWFRDEPSIEAFVGTDLTRANLPEAAMRVLSRWDERSIHSRLMERVEVGKTGSLR